QAEHGVDLVDEDNEALRAQSAWRRAQSVRIPTRLLEALCLLPFALCALRFAAREHHLAQRAHESRQRTEAAVGVPERRQRLFQPEPVADLAQEALVPLLRRDVLSETAEIQDDRPPPVLPQASGGPDHEGALAH